MKIRTKLSNIYHLYGHVVDFNYTYVRFDGKTLTSKDRIIAMFKFLLKQSGYSFEPFSRPVPPILENWPFIDRKFLNNWVKNCCHQLATIDEAIIRISVLTVDGFCIRLNDRTDCHKLVHLDMQADGYHYSTTTTINLCSTIVERFAKSNFSNKIIIIN